MRTKITRLTAHAVLNARKIFYIFYCEVDCSISLSARDGSATQHELQSYLRHGVGKHATQKINPSEFRGISIDLVWRI